MASRPRPSSTTCTNSSAACSATKLRRCCSTSNTPTTGSSRLLSAINARAKVFNAYDAIGRITETQQHHVWPGGTSNGFTTTFAYDVDSNSMRTVHYPEGRTVVETVDYRGRMVGLNGETGVGGTWTFDVGNRRSGAELANFFKSVFSYDVNDRLTNISHYHSAPPFPMPIVHYAVEYGYDVVGNRTSTRNLGREDHSQRYRYDDLNRLTMFRRGTMNTQNNNVLPANGLVDSIKANEEWWYHDDRGNWYDYWKQVGGPSADWYEETRAHNGANELGDIERYLGVSTLPTVTPVYDANGNLALDPLAPNVGTSVPDGQRNEYDPANRLTRVWRTNNIDTNGDDEKLLEIGYDALGRRVRSDEFIDTDGVALTDPQVTLHLYVGLTPIEEYAVTTNGAGGYNADLVREFVWGARFPEPVAMIDHTNAGDIPSNGGPEVLHYLHDVLGSVIALTNSDGVVVERYDYDPYGRTYLEDASSNALVTSRYGNPFMWTGQRYDAATGQYHFWARTHSPQLGRWVQRDPYGYPDGLNSYQYAVSDPIYYTDLLGHCAGGEKPKPPKNADVVYGETSSLRPKWKDPKGDKKESNYDPESVKKLHEGRKAIAEVAEKNKKVHRDTPSEEELKDPNVRREWENAQKAAKDAEDDPNLPDDAGHFFIRKGEELNDDDGKSKPDWAKGKTPCRSYGPFRKLGSSGDVPPGDDVYIDVYCGVD